MAGVIICVFQKVHKSPRELDRLPKVTHIITVDAGSCGPTSHTALQVSSPSLYRAENWSWESASIPNTQRPFLPVYLSLWDMKYITSRGERRVVSGCRENRQSGADTVEATFICKPSSAKAESGKHLNIYLFFFKKKVTWIQQGPAMRWWRHCNCLGFACVSLGREPGRT